MSIATGRMTLGSIFGAITSTANAVTTTVEAINDGVGMLNRTISVAAEKQRIETEFDMAEYAEQYALQTTLRARQFQVSMESWMTRTPDEVTKFDETHKRLLKAVEDRRKAKAP